MEGQFTVIVVDGSFAEAVDPFSGTSSIRYDGLTWTDSVELARLSFTQGFEVIIWRLDEGGPCNE